jgi:hypothetical protein
MSWDDNWSRDSGRFGREWTTPGEPARREPVVKRRRGGYVLTLVLAVVLGALCVVTLNLLGFHLL